MRSKEHLTRLQEHFQKRSWESMFPDPSDTPEIRAGKRDRLHELLEVKLGELGSFKVVPDVGGVANERVKDDSGSEIAEIAETPADNGRSRRLLGDANVGVNTAYDRLRSSATPRNLRGKLDEHGHRSGEIRRESLICDSGFDRGTANGTAARGGNGGPGSSTMTKREHRTIPRAQSLAKGILNANDEHTPNIRRKTGRESLSRALLLKRGGVDTPMSLAGVHTPAETLGTAYTNGTPGVYIPSVRKRMIDVTGTELAEDMAGNLVAGIFAASDPCSLADSGRDHDGEEPVTNRHIDMLESQIENHTEEPLRPSEQLDRIPYGNIDGNKLISLLIRFPEQCLYGRASRSGKHVAILLGSLIDKEPKEIMVMSLEDDIRVSLVANVQKSRRFFPTSIPYNVNFFDLAETTKGDPVLLISCAFELTDLETQDAGDESETKLHVLVRGREPVAVESERPIIFVEAFGDSNEVLVTGAYADEGARVMKFDPSWQSFTWKKEFEFPEVGFGADDDKQQLVTHISKLLVLKADECHPLRGPDNSGSLPTSTWIKAVLASDATCVDVVYTFSADRGKGDLNRVENAESFVDGDSWWWFLEHQKRVAELGFAGKAIGDVGHGEGSRGTCTEDRAGQVKLQSPKRCDSPLRTLATIFASSAYVATGDMHGTVTVWDVRDRMRLACKKFSIAAFEQTKVTSIVQIRARDHDTLVILGSSGVCLLVSLPELFGDGSENPL